MALLTTNTNNDELNNNINDSRGSRRGRLDKLSWLARKTTKREEYKDNDRGTDSQN